MSGQQQLPLGFEAVGEESVKRKETRQAARRDRPMLRSGSRVKAQAVEKQAIEKLSDRERKQWQAIDVLLADKPERFRATVFELCRQLGWPDDEPGFLLAIATNQLQALVQRYPERLTAAMQAATAEVSEDWQRVQAELSVNAAQSAQSAEVIAVRLVEAQRAIDQRLEKVEALIDGACENAQLSIQVELEDVSQFFERERKAMVQQAQALAEEQKGVIREHTKALIVEGVAKSRQDARDEVQEIMRTVRRKHYVEAGFWAVAAAALLSSSSWLMAWTVRGVADSSSVWGDIERWNRDHLQACVEAQQTTCSFHIEVPQAE